MDDQKKRTLEYERYRMRKAAEFEIFFRDYKDQAYRIALHYCRNELVADEIVEKMIFQLYNKYERLRKKENIMPYAYQIIKNEAFTWMRGFKRLQDGQIEDVSEEYLKIESVEDICVRNMEKKLAVDLSRSILSALYAYNKDWYEVVMLAYYFDMPQGDIAKEMGVDRYVISSRLYRAKQWIRHHHGSDYEKYKKDVQG